MRPSGQDTPTATAIPVDGPLGATRLQGALDLLAAAGPFFTTETTASYLLGSGGTYTPLKAFTLSTGTTRKLIAFVLFAGGTTVAPTSAIMLVVASARRTSGGTTSVSSPATLQSSSIAGLNVQWAVDGTDVELRFRANGAPTVRATILYAWLEQLVP